MFPRKKIKNINKIWDKRKKKLKIKNFTNLDLEGLDLSEIPATCWKGCIFKNTSVKNTGIKLMLMSLEEVDLFSYRGINGGMYNDSIICDCDFSGNDLAPYNDSDVRFRYYKNCNFRNTNITQFLPGENNLLDENCVSYTYRFYDPIIDVDTIKNNEQLCLETRSIIWAIQGIVNDDYIDIPYDLLYAKIEDMDELEIKKRVSEGEKYFFLDRSGELKRFYNILDLKLKEKLYFFNGYVANKNMEGINFEGFTADLLNAFSFINCNFKGASFDNSYHDLLTLHDQTFPRF